MLFTIYSLLIVLFSIYSYSQVDFNLTLSKNSLYLAFQNWMTHLGYFNRSLSTIIFIVLAILLFTVYFLLITRIRARSFDPAMAGLKMTKRTLLIIAAILIVGYPLLSHDIFNYTFNAKMIWLYKANPHVQVAANFSNDLWIRFMRNIHTPAPYAYGWTLISLIPGILTLTNNLKLSLWGMKAFTAFFWIGQLWILAKIIKKEFPKENYRWFLFALNPLVLIETLVIGHNDVVMMFLALVSYWFLLKTKKLFDKNFLLSLFFLGLSVSIKYATIVLLPLWLIKVVYKKLNIPTIGAILLFAIIFVRPDQLHSWYLIWAFSFAVLSKNKWVISFFTVLTFGALLRYAPYLYYGHWNPPVYLLRNLIWLLSGSLVFVFYFYNRIRHEGKS